MTAVRVGDPPRRLDRIAERAGHDATCGSARRARRAGPRRRRTSAPRRRRGRAPSRRGRPPRAASAARRRAPELVHRGHDLHRRRPRYGRHRVAGDGSVGERAPASAIPSRPVGFRHGRDRAHPDDPPPAVGRRLDRRGRRRRARPTSSRRSTPPTPGFSDRLLDDEGNAAPLRQRVRRRRRRALPRRPGHRRSPTARPSAIIPAVAGG